MTKRNYARAEYKLKGKRAEQANPTDKYDDPTRGILPPPRNRHREIEAWRKARAALRQAGAIPDNG